MSQENPKKLKSPNQEKPRKKTSENKISGDALKKVKYKKIYIMKNT